MAIFASDSQPKAPYVLETWLSQHLFEDNPILLHSSKALSKCPSDNRIYVKNFLPSIGYLSMAFLILKTFLRYIIGLLALLTGKWEGLYMLDEIVYAETFKIANSKVIHDSYIIPFQGSQARPLWTWVVEQKGARVYQLNYSTYMLPTLNGIAEDFVDLGTTKWPFIIPFNKSFSKYIEEKVPREIQIMKTPTIFFSDNPDIDLPVINRPILALFDVSPLDENKFIGNGASFDYLYAGGDDIMDFYYQFFETSLRLSKKYGFTTVVKPKRHDNRIRLEYKELISDLETTGDLIILSPNISPYRVVDSSALTIVQPFTSVGAYTDSKKTICFYDPFSVLKCSHDACFGVPLCRGEKSLENWVVDHLKK